MLGVHLEGPFLHPAKRGAHPEAHLRRLTLANLQEVLGPYTAIVKVVTLAPELDAANSTIAWLQERGILVSLGHSTATAAQARAAFGRGAGAITHTFNAMPPLHHREIGLLGAALLQEDVWCGLIADGVHVDPLAIALLWRLKGKHIVLVSDALAPLGLPDGPYPWDDRTMVVTKGTARLSDGTLAGTTLPLLAGVQNLVAWGICRAEEAIALATETPRQMLGLPPARHSLNWYEQPDGQLVWARADEPATIALP